jgi:3-dehydroquinate synthase
VAVNHALGKNLLGAFYAPEWVWIDPGYLKSLPPRQLRAGWVEGLKHALIKDRALLRELEPHLYEQSLPSPELLARVVSVKLEIVERDFHERGERALLNLGHTLGHALEATHDDLLHGEAVALGLVFALEWSVDSYGLSLSELDYMLYILRGLGVPTDWRSKLTPGALDYLKRDKKRSGDQLSCVVLPELGQAELVTISIEALIQTIERLSVSRSAP